MLRILGISGSLRRGSHNTSLLRAAAKLLPPGVELELFESLRDLPPYDPDEDGAGEGEAGEDKAGEGEADEGQAHEDQGLQLLARAAPRRLREAIASADGVLIATPEYNGSIPGVLKNALDWASRPFPDNALRGKPVAVIGASTGLFGAIWAQAEARKVLGMIGADVIDRELPIGQADAAFAADGMLLDPEQRALLAELVNVLVARAGAVASEQDAALAGAG